MTHSVSRGMPFSVPPSPIVARRRARSLMSTTCGQRMPWMSMPERVAVVQMVVEERGAQVVRRADRVDVAREVEVEVLHRDDLAVAAARGATLDPEHRAEARLADAHRRPLADVVEALGEADGRGRFALAERRRRDRGDDDVLAARVLALQALGCPRASPSPWSVRTARARRPAGPAPAAIVGDRPRRHATGDVEVRWEAAGRAGGLGRGRLGGRGGHRRLPRRRRPLDEPGTRPTWSFAARRRWVSRRALVTGPTPPGTGVIADATSRAESMSTSPTTVADDVDPDVHDHGTRLEHVAGDEPGPAGRDDHDVGPPHVLGEIGGPRMADRHRGVLAKEQERGRLAHDRRATDHHRVPTLDSIPDRCEHLDGGMGGRRQEAVVAERQQAGIERMDAVDVLGRIEDVDDRRAAGSAREAASGR